MIEPTDLASFNEVLAESETQYGGNRKKTSNKKKPVSLKKAVTLLKEYYKNKYNQTLNF